MMDYHGVKYIPDENGTAMSVDCPFLKKWIDPVECMETQAGFPVEIRGTEEWNTICNDCPFRNY